MMSLASYLTLRSEYEDIVSDFNVPEEIKVGLKESFKWFDKYGYKSNSLRSNFSRAKDICRLLLGELNVKETTTGQHLGTS
tara:strand:- start:8009 stop:8251 length:243 start_codon:yes stop_codon:yes gene_type:complete